VPEPAPTIAQARRRRQPALDPRGQIELQLTGGLIIEAINGRSTNAVEPQ
jgi:hypothetical protein